LIYRCVDGPAEPEAATPLLADVHVGDFCQGDRAHPDATTFYNGFAGAGNLWQEGVTVQAQELTGYACGLLQPLGKLVDRPFIVPRVSVVKADTDLNDPLQEPLHGSPWLARPAVFQMLVRFEEKARVEADLDNIRIEYDDYKDVTEFYSLSKEELQEKVRSALIELNRLGPVNLKAIEEFGIMNVEFEELKKKLDRLLEEKDAIMNVVKDVEQKRYSKFMETFSSISANFSKIYNDMTTGGIGRLRLEEDNNIDSGLVIESSPVGKKILNLDVMSGGEKTLTSLSFLFAVMQHSAAPFYILDEVDAALDKANSRKIANLIKAYSSHVQFLVITHNDITISMADKVFGVSMEDGVSKIFGIEMPAA